MRRAFHLFCSLALVASPALARKEATPPLKPAVNAQAAVRPNKLSLVRVNVTGQAFDYFRPWQKKAPFTKRALGAVLPHNRVLVTADLVADHNYVELEQAESGEKTPAEVTVVDYEANLALLEPSDKHFLDKLEPLELALDTVVGDRLLAWQLETTGALVVTEGLVTTIGMTHYPTDVGEFLTYRLSIPMQYRENSYTVPLVKKNKLAALLLRYDPRMQVLDAVPAPVIAHFLKDAEGEHYRGFPDVGLEVFPTRDPDLRKYAGETGPSRGVYVTSVVPGSPAAKADLRVGDIIESVGQHELDQTGNYVDKLYGKIDFTNLITTESYVGDTVKFSVLRDGKPLQLNVTMEHRALDDYVVPPYRMDEAPKYYVLGGLVFQELSRQYLREWGNNWQKEAPQRFVYYDQFQSELFPEGNRRVVILSQVLSADTTVGYEDFVYLTVTKVDGKEIHSLDDLAAALQHPIDGFYKIETQEDPRQIELNADQVAAEAQSLQENYGLPSLQNLK